MNDITMCTTEKCSKAHDCYRKNVIPNKYWQSYADLKINCNKNNDYQYYIATKSNNRGFKYER